MSKTFENEEQRAEYIRHAIKNKGIIKCDLLAVNKYKEKFFKAKDEMLNAQKTNKQLDFEVAQLKNYIDISLRNIKIEEEHKTAEDVQSKVCYDLNSMMDNSPSKPSHFNLNTPAANQSSLWQSSYGYLSLPKTPPMPENIKKYFMHRPEKMNVVVGLKFTDENENPNSLKNTHVTINQNKDEIKAAPMTYVSETHSSIQGANFPEPKTHSNIPLSPLPKQLNSAIIQKALTPTNRKQRGKKTSSKLPSPITKCLDTDPMNEDMLGNKELNGSEIFGGIVTVSPNFVTRTKTRSSPREPTSSAKKSSGKRSKSATRRSKRLSFKAAKN